MSLLSISYIYSVIIFAVICSINFIMATVSADSLVCPSDISPVHRTRVSVYFSKINDDDDDDDGDDF